MTVTPMQGKLAKKQKKGFWYHMFKVQSIREIESEST